MPDFTIFHQKDHMSNHDVIRQGSLGAGLGSASPVCVSIFISAGGSSIFISAGGSTNGGGSGGASSGIESKSQGLSIPKDFFQSSHFVRCWRICTTVSKRRWLCSIWLCCIWLFSSGLIVRNLSEPPKVSNTEFEI